MCHTLPPDFVAKAYWNGEVAASTAGVIDCAMVLATNLRTMSPHTMPRTPPPGFSKAVNLPMRSNVNTSGGTCALGKSCAARLKDDVSGADSRMTRNDLQSCLRRLLPPRVAHFECCGQTTLDQAQKDFLAELPECLEGSDPATWDA